jgi:hypothetical protein
MEVTDFVEQTGMPVGVALGNEEPPRDLNFVPRWPFQLGKSLIKEELVYKLSPKMYKFHEWYMGYSAKGLESLGILTRPEDFAAEGERVVWLQFKDIYEVYHLHALTTNHVVDRCL